MTAIAIIVAALLLGHDMDTADALGGLLAAAPKPPACNQSMQPELATYSAQARNKKGIEQ